MNQSQILNLDDFQYGLLFDVRRSIKYHDVRRAFYECWHKFTNFVTILMAGSVIFELAKPGESPGWLVLLGVLAAFAAISDMVIGFSTKASRHSILRSEFCDLEREILSGDLSDETWGKHLIRRLDIEKDEPPVYKVLDGLCRNDILKSEGIKDAALFNTFNRWQILTKDIFLWENAKVV
jgi:hypothetical protein